MKSGMEWEFLRHNRSRLRSHRHHHVHIVQTCPMKNASLIRTRQNSCTGCSRHNQRKWPRIQCLANHLDRRRMKHGLFLPQQPKGRSTPARPSCRCPSAVGRCRKKIKVRISDKNQNARPSLLRQHGPRPSVCTRPGVCQGRVRKKCPHRIGRTERAPSADVLGRVSACVAAGLVKL
jgi:hypothetical protein